MSCSRNASCPTEGRTPSDSPGKGRWVKDNKYNNKMNRGVMSMIKCKVCNVKLTARNLIDNDFCNKEVCHLVWDYVTWFPESKCGEFKSYPQAYKEK